MRAPLRPTTVARAAGRGGNSAGAMRERLEAAKANNSSVDSKLREFSHFAGRQKQRTKLHAHQQVVLVPGTFGCANYSQGGGLPLAESDAQVATKLQGYFECTRLLNRGPNPTTSLISSPSFFPGG